MHTQTRSFLMRYIAHAQAQYAALGKRLPCQWFASACARYHRYISLYCFAVVRRRSYELNTAARFGPPVPWTDAKGPVALAAPRRWRISWPRLEGWVLCAGLDLCVVCVCVEEPRKSTSHAALPQMGPCEAAAPR